MLANQLRCRQERTRYPVVLAVSIVAWVACVVSIVGVIYGAIIAAFIAIGHALWLAHLTGNGVRVGPNQLPELWERIQSAARKLGLDEIPEAYVIQSGGLLNALATKLLSRRFVIIFSDLIDSCEAVHPSLGRPGGPPTELDFILAHELGHIALGHLSWLLLPGRVTPLLGPAYSRACEYSCDACGRAVVDDVQVASRGLAILAGGPTVGSRLDLDAFVVQSAAAGGFWMAVNELNAGHPYLSKRVAALRDAESKGSAPAAVRHPLAYPLAPLLSFAAGGTQAGVMMTVMLVGVMAAVAIPSFVKYTQRARQAAAATLERRAPGAAVEDGLVRGDRFAWRMRLPGSGWRQLPEALARKQQPMADRWIHRPDKDAHLLVIGERAPGVSLKALAAAVIANTGKASPDFELLGEESWPGGRREGRLIHTRGTVGGLALEYYFGVLLDGGRAFQLVAFASTTAFPEVKDEMRSALASFEPLPAGAQPSLSRAGDAPAGPASSTR